MLTREDLEQCAEFHRIMFEDMRTEEDSASKDRNHALAVHFHAARIIHMSSFRALHQMIHTLESKGE